MLKTEIREIEKYWGAGISGLKLYTDYCKNQIRRYHRDNDMTTEYHQKTYLSLINKYEEAKELFGEELKKQLRDNPELIYESKFLFNNKKPLRDIREDYEERLMNGEDVDIDDIPEVDNPYFKEDKEYDTSVKNNKHKYYYDKENWDY